MKTDLFTSIAVFIVGTIVAFVACNLILPNIEDFTIKSINVGGEASLVDPNPEVFNYRAINPTVEVYVGDDCSEYDEAGNCIDYGVLEEEEVKPETNPEENQNQEENQEEQNQGEENGTAD